MTKYRVTFHIMSYDSSSISAYIDADSPQDAISRFSKSRLHNWQDIIDGLTKMDADHPDVDTRDFTVTAVGMPGAYFYVEGW